MFAKKEKCIFFPLIFEIKKMYKLNEIKFVF